MTVEIKGAKELKLAFKLLEKAIANKIVKKAIRDSLKPMAKVIASQAPIGTGPTKEGQTHGTIKRYTKVRAMKRKKDRIGLIVQVRATPRADTPYWSTFTDQGTANQRAQEWMTDVYRTDGQHQLDMATKGILDGIEKEANGIGRN